MGNLKFVYGISNTYGDSGWKHWVYVFITNKAAENWLRIDYNDSIGYFNSRKILKNKNEAVKIAGARMVDRAELFAGENEIMYHDITRIKEQLK